MCASCEKQSGFKEKYLNKAKKCDDVSICLQTYKFMRIIKKLIAAAV